ncbi:MAG: hypothetical protein ABI743_02775, partial [bacterium]
MRSSILLSLPLLLLAGCAHGQSAPVVLPPAGNPLEEIAAADFPDRAATWITTGKVTLQGAANNPPGAVPQPAVAHLAGGKAGDLVLLRLKTARTPAGAQRKCLIRTVTDQDVLFSRFFDSPESDIDAWRETQFMALLDHDTPVTASIYNSTVAGIWPEAMEIFYWMQARPKDDIREPNDDDDPTTRTDAARAETIRPGRSYARSFYQSFTDPGDRDLEDWYRVTVPADRAYAIQATHAGYWAFGEMRVSIYDAAFEPVIEGHKLPLTVNSTPGAASTWFIQITMLDPGLTPISDTHPNVGFLEYYLEVSDAGPVAPDFQAHVVTTAPTVDPAAIALTSIDNRLVLAWSLPGESGTHLAVSAGPDPTAPTDWDFYTCNGFQPGTTARFLTVADHLHLVGNTANFLR